MDTVIGNSNAEALQHNEKLSSGNYHTSYKHFIKLLYPILKSPMDKVYMKIWNIIQNRNRWVQTQNQKLRIPYKLLRIFGVEVHATGKHTELR